MYGRLVRSGLTTGLAVLFYESWVEEIDLDEFDDGKASDLDRPRNELGKHASVQKRASYSGVSLVKKSVCERRFFADYLGDKTSECKLLKRSESVLTNVVPHLAMKFTAPYCCDAHDNGFNLQDFLPGPLWTADSASLDSHLAKSTQPSRPSKQKKELTRKLHDWLFHTHNTNLFAFAQPMYTILADSQIKALVRPPAGTFTWIEEITAALDQGPEWETQWASKILGVITEFDSQVLVRRRPGTNKQKRIRERSGDQIENETPLEAPLSTRPRREARKPGWVLQNEKDDISHLVDESPRRVLVDTNSISKRRKV